MRRGWVLGLVVAMGCGPLPNRAPELDDVDRFGADDELVGAAYAVGASWIESFELFDLDGHVLSSNDPSVVSVAGLFQDEDSGQVMGIAQAVAAGTTELVLVDGQGAEVGRVVVSVGVPDRFELHASGPMQARLEATEIDSLSLYVGGEATFNVRFYESDARLAGTGLVQVSGSNGLWVQRNETHQGDSREWVRLQGDQTGDHSVEFWVGDVPMGTLPVEVVDDESLDGVELVFQNTEGATDGDILHVLAVVTSVDGGAVWGTESEWRVGQRRVEGQGDLFRYTFDSAASRPVSASGPTGFHGGAIAVSGTIAGVGGPVDSDEIGCDATGGAGIVGVWIAVVSLFRRRRAV